MKTTQGWAQLLPDVLTVAVAVAVLAFLAQRFYDERAGSSERPVSEVRLDEDALGVAFRDSARTLIVVVREDCPACAESMAFYRRLMTRDNEDVQVVVAAASRETAIRAYLESHRFEPDGVISVESGTLPVPGTPTLLLVAPDGLVTHAWIGVLSAAAEADVLGELFG